ncbi:wax ester/triacylglycerol synthase family O-acyltransferase [Nocardia puris]|uniref:Diacylglycerol O-acyltransferase n=2 Tax=Nocardia TaxID=1817 RepID=A0A366DE10_9NOCA|nr:wax ester/triacylglycerol synthase family O-acyltransferase [Nocardia puris]MBF6215041.1 wax ester/triacylglycerol synthase family O-acyltransferase [Nocardia puris]MBF6367192.1 wax ester/triacylglycerol synthase family O-acyltransferase [Nocardia puris]MBF6461831.1 wax ester/triacylglycerol synthase family O-acyltransferase [Nocardia puris]RBO88287.1 WS/DGAT/MGAT family acyltransferase [Nocardia puris]
MERLTGLDASFLYLETGTQHLHVCALLVLDPAAEGAPYSFDTFKAELGRRLPLVPQMRRRVREVPLNLDHPVWVADPDFDLDHHIRLVRAPSPCGHEELARLVGEIASTPMDRNRPLWQMFVVEGLDDGKVAVICKYHHAAVDGITGTNMMMHLCDIEPGAARVDTVDSAPADPAPATWKLLAEAAIRFPGRAGVLGMVPKTVGMLAGFAQRRRNNQAGMAIPLTAPRTPFNRAIGARRAVAFTATDLDAIKEIKTAFGVKVNDVVLTVVGGVLRTYLDKHGELPDKSLIASVPVSVHGSTRHTEGINKVSSLFSELGTDIDDPVARLRAVAAANRDAKDEHDLIGADFLQDWSKYAPPNVFRLASRAYSALKLAEHHPVVHNLVVSNVPGPPVPLYFLGVKVDAMYPFGPVFHGAGLTVTVLSNNGDLDFGFIACADLMPDVDVLADAVPQVIDELLTAARASD